MINIDLILMFQIFNTIDWFKGKITGKSHDLHAKIWMVSCRFFLKSTH